MGDQDASLLADILDIAVPIQLMILKEIPPEELPEILARWTAGAADLITSSDASLLYPMKKSPKTAKHVEEPGTVATFAALARGIAAAAYAPGGITAFGRYWCVNYG